jgi:nucleoside 2-deoxyribosyltransferase
MNMMGMAQAGLVVAWLGGEKPDLGVAWELGFIYGAGSLSSPPYTIAFIHDEDPRQDLNLMLAMTVDWLARGVRELDQLLEDYLSVGPMDRWNAASRADHEGAT